MARGKAILAWAASQAWAITPEVLAAGLKMAAQDGGPASVAPKDGVPLEGARKVEYHATAAGKVAVVPVVGPIFRYADNFELEMCGGTSIETVAKDFRAALDDPSVSSIVLNVDSPGGQVAGTGEFARMVRDAKKPTVAYIDDLGASAAYWIASAADRVVASPSARVGSIGVVMAARSPKPEEGEFEFVSSAAPMKRADPATEAGKAACQQTVDDLHGLFEAAVAEGRGVSREKVRSDFGRGGVMIASRALKAGMVDAIGSFEQVVEQLGRGTLPGRQKANSGGTPMGLIDRFRAWANTPDAEQAIEQELNGAAQTPEQRAFASQVAGTVITASERDELERLRKERAEAAARQVSERADAILAEANGFADGLVKDKKILPAQRSEAAVAYAQAALDDAGIVALAHPLNGTLAIQMGGRPAGRVAGIRAAYEAIPAHALDEEALPSAATFTVPPAKARKDDDAEAVAAEDDWLSRRYAKK